MTHKALHDNKLQAVIIFSCVKTGQLLFTERCSNLNTEIRFGNKRDPLPRNVCLTCKHAYAVTHLYKKVWTVPRKNTHHECVTPKEGLRGNCPTKPYINVCCRSYLLWDSDKDHKTCFCVAWFRSIYFLDVLYTCVWLETYGHTCS